jgi:hypothetical protein
LAGFLDHLLSLAGVIDDVAILERQVVLLHYGADAIAPAAGWLHVGGYIWFFHFNLIKRENKLP